jgi:hypothetical protein
MMSQDFEQPEIFQIGPKSTQGPTEYNEIYGNAPLVLSGFSGEDGNKYIQMERFIHLLQQNPSPLSYHYQEDFPYPEDHYLRRLGRLENQKYLYQDLNVHGFDFSKIPFKLQKWDQVSKQWRMLTIDYQITGACFLVFLSKNPRASFEDTAHTDGKLKFVTKPVYRGNSLEYVEVTPLLEKFRFGDAVPVEEILLLTLEECIRKSFPNLTFTMPSILDAPSRDFACLVCLEEEVGDGLIFKAMCGHCFHRHCIEQWFESSGKNTCPLCRRSILRDAVNSS